MREHKGVEAMKFVAYYRVSTKKQGASGLGLEAQEAAVQSFLSRDGGALVLPPFIEVESGKRKNRPELAKAIAHARKHRAKLLVAKLDRLARNVAFTSQLMEGGVDFVCCDNPHATRLTIHVLAAVAEHEAQAISQRTKAALQAAKARGSLLGSHRPGHWEGREQARERGQAEATKAAAEAKKAKRLVQPEAVAPLLKELQAAGLSLRAMAEKLNEKGTLSLSGLPWNPMGVSRILKACK
jgi:DNA invertase Pin-like site-specific DNA recombinase